MLVPNIKNQAKRVVTNSKRQTRNKANKSELKSALKAVENAVLQEDKALAVEKLQQAYSLLDLSVAKNLHHKNYVARQKSRLTKAVNNLK